MNQHQIPTFFMGRNDSIDNEGKVLLVPSEDKLLVLNNEATLRTAFWCESLLAPWVPVKIHWSFVLIAHVPRRSHEQTTTRHDTGPRLLYPTPLHAREVPCDSDRAYSRAAGSVQSRRRTHGASGHQNSRIAIGIFPNRAASPPPNDFSTGGACV